MAKFLYVPQVLDSKANLEWGCSLAGSGLLSPMLTLQYVLRRHCNLSWSFEVAKLNAKFIMCQAMTNLVCLKFWVLSQSLRELAMWPCTGHFIFLGPILLISFMWAVPLTCRKMAVWQGCRFHCWLAHKVKRFLCNLCSCLPPLIVHSLLLIVPSGKTQISLLLFTHLEAAVRFPLNLSWWYVWSLFLPCCSS